MFWKIVIALLTISIYRIIIRTFLDTEDVKEAEGKDSSVEKKGKKS